MREISWEMICQISGLGICLRPEARSINIKCEHLLRWIEQPRVFWDFGRTILLSLEDWKGFVGLDYKVRMNEISLKMEWVNERKRKAEEM